MMPGRRSPAATLIVVHPTSARYACRAIKCSLESSQPPGVTMPFSDRTYVLDSEAGRIAECIESRHHLVERAASPDVESRACHGGHAHPRDLPPLVIAQEIRPRDRPARWSPVRPDQLNGCVGVDPPRAVQRRRTDARDRRPDHSHAAYARWCSVGVILRSRYTFGITAR